MQADGKILAGGNFTSIGGQTRNRIARLDPTTGLADSFNPNANNLVLCNRGAGGRQDSGGRTVHTLAPNGGATVTRNHIARLETDGRLDQTLNLSTVGNLCSRPSRCSRMARFSLAGFYQCLGRAAQHIARLNTDGTLDTAFNPNANGVLSIRSRCSRTARFWWAAISPSIGGQPRNFIARLDATTGLADSFNPNANSVV